MSQVFQEIQVSISDKENNQTPVYVIDKVKKPDLRLNAGKKYHFKQSLEDHKNYPLRISTTREADHNPNNKKPTTINTLYNYIIGNKEVITEFVVPSNTHELYYYCGHKLNMGSNIHVKTFGKGFKQRNKGGSAMTIGCSSCGM